jgi:hypothetical protein
MDEKEARSAVIGAISMALKDPTLQQGFECICKENAELKKMYHESDEDNNKLRENIPKLAEAKDHIKRLLDCLKQDTNDPQTNYYVCQYMDKAEQFLSEVEK